MSAVDSTAEEPRADHVALRRATLSTLFGEIARRGLAYAAWNTAGQLIRSNNPFHVDGSKVFDADVAAFDDDEIYEEFVNRNFPHIIWGRRGEIESEYAVPQAWRQEIHDVEEAAASLRRGDLFEALIHLERAIPALDGLHDAVRKLQR